MEVVIGGVSSMCNRHRQSSIAARISPSIGLLVAALAGLLAAPPTATAQPASRQSQSQCVVHLAGGGRSAGEILALAYPGNVRCWKAASIDLPRHADWSVVTAIEWPPAAKPPKPAGDFSFELAGGDVVFGSLLALDDKQVELDVPRLGRIHVQRSSLRRLDRRGGDNELIYLGPNGLVGWKEALILRDHTRLAGWKDTPGQSNWRTDWGRPTTDQFETSIRSDVGLAALVSIELEISWKSKPDFFFTLGVDETVKSVQRAFGLEAWGTDLIIQRELETEADLAVLQERTTAAPAEASSTCTSTRKTGGF